MTQPPRPPEPAQPQPQPQPAPGWGATGYHPLPPRHPEAEKVLVLGLVGLVGGFVCYLPLLVAPFAWFVGNRVVREIDASQGQLSGRDSASAGRILGIIGTALLAAAVLLVGSFLAFFAVSARGIFW